MKKLILVLAVAVLGILAMGCSTQDMSVYNRNTKVSITTNNGFTMVNTNGNALVYYSDKFFKNMGTFDGHVMIRVLKDRAEVLINSDHNDPVVLKVDNSFVSDNGTQVYFRHKGDFYFVSKKKLRRMYP